MAVKLIASDLDGTLLRNDKSISEETGKALEKAREAGIYFVPSTGRAMEAVPVEVMALPGVEYVITSNGAAVYSVSGGTRIYLLRSPISATVLITLPFTHPAGKYFRYIFRALPQCIISKCPPATLLCIHVLLYLPTFNQMITHILHIINS